MLRELVAAQFGRHPYRSLVFLLFLLIGFSYLPATIFSLSTNPLVFDSGLTTGERRGLIPGLPTIDPNAGTTTQALGKLSAEDWIHGRIPWWNPYSGIGLPLAAEMQSSSLFFPFILLLLFSKGVLYLRVAMQVLAGVATFALLRRLRCGLYPAILGSVLFALNGTFAWFQHASILPIPFLPLLLLGIETSFQESRTRRPGGWALISLAIAGSLYAGFPETAYLDGLLAIPWIATRLLVLPWSQALRFLGKNIAGCILGLLLSAPALLPFFEYLQHSVVVHADFAGRAIPPSSFLQLLLPYSLGTIEGFLAGDPTNELITDWGDIGGYLGLASVFLGSLALWSGPRDRLLRIVLGLWTCLMVWRSVSVHPFVSAIFHAVPGLALVAIYRYGLPSCQMALAVLAAFALEDWQAGRLKKIHVLSALLIPAALLLLGFRLSAPLLTQLWIAEPKFHKYFIGSVLVGALALSASALLCSLKPSGRSGLLLSLAVGGEALVLFAFPSLAGFRHAALDLGPVDFLQKHLGLQRYYSLGQIHQNYSAYFGIASLNYEMLPLSDTWASHVVRAIDPGASQITFSGDYPPPQTERNGAVLQHMEAFEEAGVKYIVSAPGSNPFLDQVELPHAPTGNVAETLATGESLSGLLPPLVRSGTIDALAVDIGTNRGRASGTISLQLCSSVICVTGQALLLHAIDNASLPIPLMQSLRGQTGDRLRFTLTHSGGDFPAAVWMYPSVGGAFSTRLANGRSVPLQPLLKLTFQRAGNTPRLVYESPNSRIFELPNPAPYFQAVNGSCAVNPASREVVRLDCRAPATLVRRELFYPGWSASIDRRAASALHAYSVFQSLEVPAGKSLVTFRYTPTHIGYGYAAGLLAVVGLITQLRRRNSGSPQPPFEKLRSSRAG